jgi:hypothetical protein
MSVYSVTKYLLGDILKAFPCTDKASLFLEVSARQHNLRPKRDVKEENRFFVNSVMTYLFPPVAILPF